MLGIKFWMLERKLKDKDSADRREAVLELARSGEGRAVEILTDLLRGEGGTPAGGLTEAADALGEAGGSVAVSALLAVLEPGPGHFYGGAVEDAAVRALGRIADPRAIGPLATRMMQWTHNEVAYQVPHAEAEALRRLGWQPSTPEERAVFFVALGEYERAVAEGPAAIRPLLATAARGTPAAPPAVETLAKLGSVAVEPLLKPLAQGRAFAAVALGKIGDGRAIEPLAQALTASARVLYGAGTAAMVSGGTPIDPANDCCTAVIEALAALARRGEGHAATALAAFVQDPAHPAAKRVQAAAVLGKLGASVPPQAVELLVAALRDSSGRVRYAAAEALGMLGDVRAVEPLIAISKDSDPSVRSSVAYALGRLRDPRAVEPLMGMVQEWIEDPPQRATMALGEIGDPRPVKLLLSCIRKSGPVIEDDDTDLPSSAVNALEKLLTRAASQVAVEDLQSITELDDVLVWTWTEEDYEMRETDHRRLEWSCTGLKQMARQEIIRRCLEP